MGVNRSVLGIMFWKTSLLSGEVSNVKRQATLMNIFWVRNYDNNLNSILKFTVLYVSAYYIIRHMHVLSKWFRVSNSEIIVTVVPIEAFRKMLTNSFPNLKEHLWTIPQQFDKFLKKFLTSCFIDQSNFIYFLSNLIGQWNRKLGTF